MPPLPPPYSTSQPHHPTNPVRNSLSRLRSSITSTFADSTHQLTLWLDQHNYTDYTFSQLKQMHSQLLKPKVSVAVYAMTLFLSTLPLLHWTIDLIVTLKLSSTNLTSVHAHRTLVRIPASATASRQDEWVYVMRGGSDYTGVKLAWTLTFCVTTLYLLLITLQAYAAVQTGRFSAIALNSGAISWSALVNRSRLTMVRNVVLTDDVDRFALKVTRYQLIWSRLPLGLFVLPVQFILAILIVATTCNHARSGIVSNGIVAARNCQGGAGLFGLVVLILFKILFHFISILHFLYHCYLYSQVRFDLNGQHHVLWNRIDIAAYTRKQIIRHLNTMHGDHSTFHLKSPVVSDLDDDNNDHQHQHPQTSLPVLYCDDSDASPVVSHLQHRSAAATPTATHHLTPPRRHFTNRQGVYVSRSAEHSENDESRPPSPAQQSVQHQTQDRRNKPHLPPFRDKSPRSQPTILYQLQTPHTEEQKYSHSPPYAQQQQPSASAYQQQHLSTPYQQQPQYGTQHSAFYHTNDETQFTASPLLALHRKQQQELERLQQQFGQTMKSDSGSVRTEDLIVRPQPQMHQTSRAAAAQGQQR